MRILILSDTHSSNVEMDLSSFDYVFHCGDRGVFKKLDNIYYVRGNCDFRGPKEIEMEINNKKFYITHGDMYGVKQDYNRLFYRAKELNADVVLFGHTHRCAHFEIEDILFINPGAYEDTFYVIIDNDSLEYYMGERCYKKFEFKW
ncbi:MAG: metallophosphoesterase [Erysipelotrichaceae bacterium]|nr:metallophosphoesterase [Erysipelotrichaceae bacterium]